MSNIRKFMNIVESKGHLDEFFWRRKPEAEPARSNALADRMNAIAAKPVAPTPNVMNKADTTPAASGQSGSSADRDPNTPRRRGNEREPAHEVFTDHAPALGGEFTYRGSTYQVVGYMREVKARGMFGKRGGGLVACAPHAATWVIGMGGGGPGTLAPVERIRPTGGSAKWSARQRQAVEHSMIRMIDAKQTFTKPTGRH